MHEQICFNSIRYRQFKQNKAKTFCWVSRCLIFVDKPCIFFRIKYHLLSYIYPVLLLISVQTPGFHRKSTFLQRAWCKCGVNIETRKRHCQNILISMLTQLKPSHAYLGKNTRYTTKYISNESFKSYIISNPNNKSLKYIEIKLSINQLFNMTKTIAPQIAQ